MQSEHGSESRLKLVIRGAVQHDLENLARIALEGFPAEQWPVEALELELCREGACFLLAEEQTTGVLGYLMAWQALDELHLLQVAVRQDARRQGVASALIRRMLELLRSRDCSVVFLEVRASNRAALAFYEGVGFLEIGRRRRYYDHPTEDAVVMALQLRSNAAQHPDFSLATPHIEWHDAVSQERVTPNGVSQAGETR